MDPIDIFGDAYTRARMNFQRKYPQLSGAQFEAHFKAFIDKAGALQVLPQKRTSSHASLVVSGSKRPAPVGLRSSRVTILV